jgi:hypothetical protein
MKKKLLLLICVMMCFEKAQSQISVSDSPKIHIAHPEKANPEKDCERALREGDARFVGVAGIALNVPGVPEYYPRYWKKNGVKVIAETSDVGNRPFNRAAQAYAERYNAALLKHLVKERRNPKGQ